MAQKISDKLLENIMVQLEKLGQNLEKASIAEYVELYRRPKRLLFFNFLAGVVRGFGFAIGFTVVGAIFVYALGKIASLNLPVVGEFIAEITRIVQYELSGRP